MKKTLYALCATTALALATPVLAQTITTGESETITFGGPAGTTESSTLQLTFDSFSGGIATYSYVFTNTAPALGGLVGFGFSTDPNLVSVSDGTLAGFTDLDFVLDGGNYGGFTIEACAYSGTNCNAANDMGDLFGGTFSLNFGADATGYTLDSFVARYAGLTELNGGSGFGTPPVGPPPPPPPPIPEPSTWAMMLMGFGGVGYAMRRRRKQPLPQIA